MALNQIGEIRVGKLAYSKIRLMFNELQKYVRCLITFRIIHLTAEKR